MFLPRHCNKKAIIKRVEYAKLKNRVTREKFLLKVELQNVTVVVRAVTFELDDL